MATTEQRGALTLEAFLRLPEEEPALEYVEGRLTQKVSPRGRHSRLQYVLCELINRFGQPRRLALAFPELRTTFAGRSVVPDVAVYRWERIPVSDSGEVADTFAEPPNVAIEIRSPEQSLRSQTERCAWYVASGVRAALLLDPDDRSVRLFRPGEPMAILWAADRLDLGEVLPGFQVTVRDLFDPLRLR